MHPSRTSGLTPWLVGVAALLLASGSAYAGQTVGKNSVGSKQVKNNSLTGKDIKNGSLTGKDIKNGSLTGKDVKDGSLGKADLRTGTVPDVYTFIGTVPGDGAPQTVLEIPDFSRFVVTCTAETHQLFVQFGPTPPIPPGTPHQQHGIAAADIADNVPVGAATIIGPGGGVGFFNPSGASPGSGILTRGDYWGRSADRLAHGSFGLAFPSSAGCLTRLQVVVERLAVPAPVPRASAGQGRGETACEASGAAFCATD